MNKKEQAVYDAALDIAKYVEQGHDFNANVKVKKFLDAVKAAHEPEFVEGEAIMERSAHFKSGWVLSQYVEGYDYKGLPIRHPTLVDLQKMHPTGYMNTTGKFCIPLPEDSSDE